MPMRFKNVIAVKGTVHQLVKMMYLNDKQAQVSLEGTTLCCVDIP